MRRERVIVSVLSLLLLIVGALLYQPFHGFRVEVILSGSMKPSVNTGSLVIIRELHSWQYQIGDIVSFRPPTAHAESITHRIIDLDMVNGVNVMRTKGDANSSSDLWQSSLGSISGKVLFSIPWIGYPVAWLRLPIGFIGVAIFTFCLCVLPQLIELWHSLRPPLRNLQPET